MISVQPLSGNFGAEVSGIDLSQPLSSELVGSLLDIFFENRVMLIRGQALNPEHFDRFVRIFGEPKRHFLKHLTMPDNPTVLLLSNIFENGKPIGVYEGAAFWHTDSAYEETPQSATIVYGRKSPAGGSPTYFADMYGAYDALPRDVKDRIDDLTAIHRYADRDTDRKPGTDSGTSRMLTDELRQRIRDVHHPLVLRHPVTGRKALYAVSGSSFGIVGMPEEKAVTFLDGLKAHALQPQFVASYNCEPGDILAWDTLATLHKATALKPATGDEDSRLLWRISVTGQPPSRS